MLTDKPLALGKLNGTIYDFSEVGDELPRHVHSVIDIHISIVARGRFLTFGDGWEQEISCGMVLDWEPGVYHGFKALEPDSRLINIIKG